MEVTVRGAGVFGLGIAWVCARRGARVTVVDPYGPGSGASGGIVGALAPHVPERWNEKKAFQLESLARSEAFWTEVDAIGGGEHLSGYGQIGRVQPVEDGKGLERARERGENAKALWGAAGEWDVVKAEASTVGWEMASGSGYVIRDTLSGRIHPKRAVESLVAALDAVGVKVVAEADDRGVVCHAKGCGETGGGLITPIKGQAALLQYDAGQDVPQVFVDGIHVIPHSDGTTAVGSTTEREFDSPTSTDDQILDVVARAKEALPQLRDAPVVGVWAGVRPRARSRAPMLGAHPLHPGQFVANGGFKIGFGMVPQVAHVMADLMLDGDGSGIPPVMRPPPPPTESSPR